MRTSRNTIRWMMVTTLVIGTILSATLTTASLPVFTSSDIDADGHIAYVDILATNAFTLVTEKCTTDGVDCTGFDPTGASDIDDQTSVAVSATVTPTPEEDPCAGGADDVTYNQGLHIGGIFIILSVSLLGAGLPVLGKYIPFFAVHPYVLVFGKCLGIGIILACALIHMLQPSVEELSSECLSKAFTEDYGAYPYLFCMLAIIVMQFVDFIVEDFIVGRVQADPSHKDAKPSNASPETEQMVIPVKEKQSSVPVVIKPNTDVCVVSDDADSTDLTSGSYQNAVVLDRVEIHPGKREDCETVHESSGSGESITVSPRVVDTDLEDGTSHHVHVHTMTLEPEKHGHSHGGHVHSVLFLKGVKRTIAAYMLEFSVTAHSIFIGITTGIVSQSEFKALIVALVFHQFFEGVALGSRIAEADLGSRGEEAAMIAIFALSAPLGMAIGVGVTSTINPEGSTYNYASGIFDAVCAGILIYIGLMLMLRDFPEDLQRHCGRDRRLKAGMFIALWTGAGVMAYIGKYL